MWDCPWLAGWLSGLLGRWSWEMVKEVMAWSRLCMGSKPCWGCARYKEQGGDPSLCTSNVYIAGPPLQCSRFHFLPAYRPEHLRWLCACLAFPLHGPGYGSELFSVNLGGHNCKDTPLKGQVTCHNVPSSSQHCGGIAQILCEHSQWHNAL